MRQRVSKYIFLPLLSLLLFSGCLKFDEAVPVELPDYVNQLTVSCYLTPGLAPELMLTESKGAYETFGDSTINGMLEEILVTDALVTISHHGQVDTLTFGLDARYRSNVLIPQDYEEVYFLDVWHEGRHLTGSTRILPPVDVDSVAYELAQTEKIAVATYFTPPNDDEVHYFYQIVQTDQVGRAVPRDLFNTEIFNGRTTPFLTDYDFESGDVIWTRLIHIPFDHYEFIRTADNASESNWRPFSEPGPVAHNVEGGYGIFTGFDYSWRVDTIP